MMGEMVGVVGIEPTVRFRDGVTVHCLTLRRHTRYLARVLGIEPRFAELEAAVLPLHYTDILAGRAGLEPATNGLEGRYSIH